MRAKSVEYIKKIMLIVFFFINSLISLASSFPANLRDGFLIQDIGEGKVRVNQIDIVSGNITKSEELKIGGTGNNGYGYNPIDNYIYGVQIDTNTSGAYKYYLVKIEPTGSGFSSTKTEIKNLVHNRANGMFIGDFDKTGNLYVAGDEFGDATNGPIFKINLSTATATKLNIDRGSPRFADWGYTDKIGGEERLYFISNNGGLFYFKKNGDSLSKVGPIKSGLPTNGEDIIGIFIAGTDLFYYPANSSKLYKIDLLNLERGAHEFSNIANPSQNGDAARNYNMIIPDLALAKEVTNGNIFPQGSNIKYKITIKNTGDYPLGNPNFNSQYTISDTIESQKVSTVATEVTAKLYDSLTGNSFIWISNFPTTIDYVFKDSQTSKFELKSEGGPLPEIPKGSRLEIEYTLVSKLYPVESGKDQILNRVEGSIPGKNITSDAQVSITTTEIAKIDKISLTPTINMGELALYSLKIINTGNKALSNYILEDIPDLTKVDISTINVKSIKVNGNFVSGTFKVDSVTNPTKLILESPPQIPIGGVLEIEYTLKSKEFDTNINNKIKNIAKLFLISTSEPLIASAEVIVNDKIDIDIEKLASKTEIDELGTIDYTINLTNKGQTSLVDYTLIDKPDQGKVDINELTNLVIRLDGIILKNTTFLYNPSTNHFELGGKKPEIPSGKSLTINYTLKSKSFDLTQGNDILNTATVEIKDITKSDTVSVSVKNTKKLLELYKNGELLENNKIKYEIILKNTGNIPLELKSLSDIIITEDKSYIVSNSGKTTYKSNLSNDILNGSYIYENNSGEITFINLPKQIEINEEIAILYEMNIDNSKYVLENPGITNVVSILIDEKEIKAEVTVNISNIEIQKTSPQLGETLQSGETVHYLITLTNKTSVPFKGYVVYDKLLTDYNYITLEDVTTPTIVGDSIFKFPGATIDIPANETIQIAYSLTIPLIPETEKLPVTISNVVADKKVDVFIDKPSVLIAKTSDKTGQVVQAGEVIGYTLKLTNPTKVDAKNYVVKDTLLSNPLLTKPEDVLVEGGSLEGDIFESTGGSVTVPAGKTVTITYTVKVPSEYPNETIVNSVNNGEEVVVEYDDPSVTVVKTSDKTGQVVQSGEVIGYTLKLTNPTKVDAKNYVVKDTLLSNPLLTKPEDVLVEGGSLEGDIFESTGGSVTVPAGKTVTITYTVKVPNEYPNETIVNSVNNGEEVVVEVDKPVVRLRHDVFGYEEKFDDSNELINQDKGIVTDFENIENKNNNPPVILPGNKAIHFISLINPSKVDLKGKSDINHQLDGKQLKDDNGNPAFSEHKFQGIVLTNLDTNEKVFYSEKELNGGQVKAKNTREARALPEANELKITPKTSSFTFEEKIPSRTAISFVFSSTVNSEGEFNKNIRITSYAFLPFDPEQNTSEGELRKAVIVIGRREANLVLSKSVEIEEASVGKFVPYTIEIKNMGQDPVENIIIVDKLPSGFTYVEGSAVQELKDGYAEKKLQVTGTKEIEIGLISKIDSGETIKIKYLLKVGVGVKPGTYKNIAVVKNENKENVSNTDSVDIDIVADPIFEHTTVIGKVFHDRDEDGIQDYADAKKVHISVDIPKEYYIKNTTTVSKDGKNYSFADKYTTITIRNIKGRVSELEPSTNNMVVIRKELIKPIMANVRVQTLGGTDITQQNNGNIITKHIGDKAKGMTSQDIIITQRVVKNKNGQIFLEIFVLNNGIQEEGLPGVRLATPEGIVVETDRFGRYHVPPVAETLGKNYIIKVDPVTLPKGARFTTENPRVRHLGKVMMKFNFGVKLPELLPKQLSDK